MELPTLMGSCTQQDPFFYTACDSLYFDEFGQALVNSALANSAFGVHLHLYNPRAEQLAWCQQRPRVSVTWETVGQEAFLPSAQRWTSTPTNTFDQQCLRRTQTAMVKGNDRSMLERMQKTYYACARFIRLNEIFGDCVVLAIDVDAVVRLTPPALSSAQDFYIHFVEGKDPRYLAGGIWLNPTAGSRQFLTQYADRLKSHISRDHLYWSLDQDLLLDLVPQFQTSQLPATLIDWHMSSTSCIWTAKGTKKNNAVFVNERQRYMS